MIANDEQYSVFTHVDPDDPNRAADIVIGTTMTMAGMTITVSARVQAVAWAGMGAVSLSDVQWLDELRALLVERMANRD